MTIKVLKTGMFNLSQTALIHNFIGITRNYLIPEDVDIKDESSTPN